MLSPYLVFRQTYTCLTITQESYVGRPTCVLLIVIDCAISVVQLNHSIIVGELRTGNSQTPLAFATESKQKYNFIDFLKRQPKLGCPVPAAYSALPE